MPLKVICWNIQTINPERASNQRLAIAKHIREQTNDYQDPFILFILENKLFPIDVLGILSGAIKSSCESVGQKVSINSNCVGMGGGGKKSLDTEYVLVIFSGDISLNKALEFTKWRQYYTASYNKYCNTTDRGRRSKKRKVEESNGPAASAKRRKTTKEPVKYYDKALKPPKDATELRNPVLFVFKYSSKNYRIVVLHSPGPSHTADTYDQPYAIPYGRSVIDSARIERANIVIGDFNVRGMLPPSGWNPTLGARALRRR